MFKALKNTFTWGRADRREYWYFMLFLVIIAFALHFLEMQFSPSLEADKSAAIKMDNPETSTNIIGRISDFIMILLAIPAFTVTVRRLHDTNRGAWWAILNIFTQILINFMLLQTNSILLLVSIIISLIINIILIIFLVLKGNPNPNRFGPPLSEQLLRTNK